MFIFSFELLKHLHDVLQHVQSEHVHLYPGDSFSLHCPLRAPICAHIAKDETNRSRIDRVTVETVPPSNIYMYLKMYEKALSKKNDHFLPNILKVENDPQALGRILVDY